MLGFIFHNRAAKTTQRKIRQTAKRQHKAGVLSDVKSVLLIN